MIRLCEFTGLTQADMAEVTAFLLGLYIVVLFIGDVLFLGIKRVL